LRANIITRGTRPLGYGFVAYETLVQAEQAASTHDKTELGGRTINVEVAKPKVERAPRTPKEPKEPKEAVEAGDSDEVKPRSSRNVNRRRKASSRNKTRVCLPFMISDSFQEAFSLYLF